MYHLCKQTRVYDGEPYSGYTSNYEPAERATLKEAIELAMRFDRSNPVGWNIYDSETGKLVFGVEYCNERGSSNET